jgi:D-alanyl-D-alanine dipeptidase
MVLASLALALALFSCSSCSKDEQANQEQDKSGPPVGITPVIQPEDAPTPPAPADSQAAAQTAAPAVKEPGKDAAKPEDKPQTAEDKAKAAAPTPLDGSRQVVLVITGGWRDFKGKMLRLTRPSLAAPWSVVESRWPCVIGKNGLAWGRGVYPQKPEEPAKHEGDGRSPAGVFRLNDMFGSENTKLVKTLGLKMPYLKLEQTNICVNDPASSSFNKIVDSAKVKPDFKRFERMLRSDKANRWGVFIEDNPAPIAADAGSCMFLNIWASPSVSTAGSTGISEPDMRELLLWLDPAAKPLLVQLPVQELAKLKDAWRLPAKLTP